MLMARELPVPLVEKVGLEPTISRLSDGCLNHLDDFSINNKTHIGFEPIY